jgi:hypothetical protein
MSNIISETERLCLKEIAESDYRDGNGLLAPVWAFTCNRYLKSKQYSGAVSSLKAKGFVTCSGNGKDATVALTPDGVDCLQGHGAFQRVDDDEQEDDGPRAHGSIDDHNE